MIDIHNPHESIHSWRDILIHLAIVVVGILIALGLEQTIEFFHLRHQVAEMRIKLRQERDLNHRHMASEINHWRRTSVALKNNLLVLRYLQQHPHASPGDLPGVLDWESFYLPFTSTVWEEAKQTGIVDLMPHEEIADNTRLYAVMRTANEDIMRLGPSMVEAERYRFQDSNPLDLSPAQIQQEIELTEKTLGIQLSIGADLADVSRFYSDFPPFSISEVSALQEKLDPSTQQRFAHAAELTRQRKDAVAPPPSLPTNSPTAK